MLWRLLPHWLWLLLASLEPAPALAVAPTFAPLAAALAAVPTFALAPALALTPAVALAFTELYGYLEPRTPPPP